MLVFRPKNFRRLIEQALKLLHINVNSLVFNVLTRNAFLALLENIILADDGKIIQFGPYKSQFAQSIQGVRKHSPLSKLRENCHLLIPMKRQMLITNW